MLYLAAEIGTWYVAHVRPEVLEGLSILTTSVG